MNSLRIPSGGAAQGLVTHLAPALKSITAFNLTGEFGAVGAMADKLRHGDPADIDGKRQLPDAEVVLAFDLGDGSAIGAGVLVACKADPIADARC